MKPFEHIETLDASIFDVNTDSLRIEESSSPKIILLRSIVGSVKIRHILSQKEFDQSIDYLDLNNTNPETNPLIRLKNYISDELPIEDFTAYFANKKLLYQNNEFFKRLNNEFTNYYYYENKHSYTTAFIYVYRILELISYAFPLIYASKTDDFNGTYSFFKSFFKGNSDSDKGELGFFKSFIKVIFKDNPINESSIRIDIKGETEDVQQIFFDAIRKVCTRNIFDDDDCDEPRRIAIKFTEYSSFIINVRNRFFHLFNGGHSNLQSDEIIDADYFFSLINSQSINWICIVLVEILNFSIERTTDN